jgi:tripartite-type tricarboxylate transporter receptor subunit TctC
MNTNPRRAACMAIAGPGLAWVLPAMGQAAWPAEPVTVVVNSAPGSSIDAVARAVTAPLTKALSQPVVVDNRSGAAGNIGAEAVVRASPDGYTVLASPASTIAVNPFIYPSLRFAPMKVLEPVAAAANMVSLLVVRAGLPANSVAEFMAYA